MVSLSDQKLFTKLHDDSFPAIDFSNPTYLDSFSNDVGVAILKVTTETILVLDDQASKIAKAKACKEMFYEMRKKLISHGLDDTHLFLLKDEEHFSALLRKHFGFTETTGKCLYWQSR